MNPTFTAETFPQAIRNLFELNNYSVHGPVQLHGAEIDLVARSLADPFAATVYIEATIEYVDNVKYGKDVGKLAMMANLEPQSRRVIVSLHGFSLPVQERAAASGIDTLTYDELFARFEKFDPYITLFAPHTQLGGDLSCLDGIYEEPHFEDKIGTDSATSFLTQWAVSGEREKNWLIVVGEYGSGKTALTKVLQYRWMALYKQNPRFPIPFRIELRDFTRQFDARGLLHHFLDRNGLGHLSLDFINSLMKAGRIILLLDGYDEMAQYLHARERRTCLEALAELSSGGVKGILTSRPNYFTESEELQVFEILYSSLEKDRYYLTKQDRELVSREAEVDQLLARFLDRYERTLKELSQEQTEALVARVLSNDESGKDVVLSILRRVFRAGNDETGASLSGKPVIITYLLEIVEGLKESRLVDRRDQNKRITDWGVYKLIVDQLMLRDLRRSPDISPDHRREFLAKLGVLLSKREHAYATEEDFKDLISKEFSRDIQRQSYEGRTQVIERLFADLRGSSTLTRSRTPEKGGWAFSHNSLREYLVAEHYAKKLERGEIPSDSIPISDAMRIFVASREREDRQMLLRALQALWQYEGSNRALGGALSLVWDGILELFSADLDAVSSCLKSLGKGTVRMRNIDLSRISFRNEDSGSWLRGSDFSGSGLWSVDFGGADLTASNFHSTVMDGVSFAGANLSEAVFSGAVFIDTDFSATNVEDADLSAVKPEDISIIVETRASPRKEAASGLEALGWLRFLGARTANICDYYVYKHYPSFPIVDKIVSKLQGSSLHQRRGLEQRGTAHRDVAFARSFVRLLEAERLIHTPRNRKDLVEVTEIGREVFSRFGEGVPLPQFITRCLDTEDCIRERERPRDEPE